MCPRGVQGHFWKRSCPNPKKTKKNLKKPVKATWFWGQTNPNQQKRPNQINKFLVNQCKDAQVGGEKTLLAKKSLKRYFQSGHCFRESRSREGTNRERKGRNGDKSFGKEKGNLCPTAPSDNSGGYREAQPKYGGGITKNGQGGWGGVFFSQVHALILEPLVGGEGKERGIFMTGSRN